MTREEAIEKLELLRQKVDEETYRALILAIKALEQDPCDTYAEGYLEGYYDGLEQKLEEPCDAISREAVCNIVNDIRDCISVEGYWAILERLKKLPSVTQKSGKWIELPKALNPNENPCKCSECGHILSFMNCYPKSNYCPNCGAKMESEDV